VSRFQYYGRSDTVDTGSGDYAWLGIDMTRDKPNLQPGMMSLGQNSRCRTGRVRQRNGTILPTDFNIDSGIRISLVGSGVFRNPNGDEVLLVAPAGQQYTWAFQYGKDPVKINYSAALLAAEVGVTNGGGAVEFVQSFNKIQMLRNPVQAGQKMIVWDGSNAHFWEEVALSATGKTIIPNTWTGEPFMDRIIFYYANSPAVTQRDAWLMSDIEDYSSYDDVYQSFRTNPGEADIITRILSYFRGSVIVFKNQSIHMVQLIQTFPVQISNRILSRDLGSIGNRMPVMVGGDIIFLASGLGFYRLSEIVQEQIVTLPVPISEPIQDMINQINWPYTSLYGCSAALENYAFFGVAIGAGVRRLNTILVYDTQRRQWESAGDTWADPTFEFNKLHVTNYGGLRRIFALDYSNAIIYLLYEGVNDEILNGTFSVPFKMETRGYIGDDAVRFKKFGRAMVGISTYDPSITVTAITDGFNEEKVLTPQPITKNRLRFYQHGHKAFDVTTDDAQEQKREDYSISNPDNVAFEDFENLPVGPISRIPASSPMVAGDQQQSVEPLLVRVFGRWVAFRVENDSGVCEVTSVEVDSIPAMNVARTVV
jgi:hypothetical protein